MIITGQTFTTTTSRPALRLVDVSDCAYEGCVFRGDPDLPVGYGVELIRSAGVSFRNCLFEGVGGGIKAIDGKDLVVTQSEFRRVGADGVIYAGQEGYEISYNLFHDWRPNGKHADAIQSVRPDDRNRPNIGGRIIGNTIRGPDMQGVFIPEAVDTLVEDNQIRVAMANAIGCANSIRTTLRNNDIRTWPGSTTIARIEARGAVDLRYDGVNLAATYSRFRQIVYPATA